MYYITRRRGRVYLYFVSPSGQKLKQVDISGMSVSEFLKYTKKEGK